MTTTRDYWRAKDKRLLGLLREALRHDLRVALHGPDDARARGQVEALRHVLTRIDNLVKLGVTGSDGGGVHGKAANP